VLIVCSLVVAAYFSRRAPAVSLALVGGVLGGYLGYRSSNAIAVPMDVAEYMVLGILVCGIAGLFIRPRASARYLWWASLGAALVGMLVVLGTWIVMHVWTCFAYDPPSRRWCDGTDMFMGTSGIVTAYTAMSAFIIVGLFMVSARRAERVRTSELETGPNEAK
jgi:hypothetical protein